MWISRLRLVCALLFAASSLLACSDSTAKSGSPAQTARADAASASLAPAALEGKWTYVSMTTQKEGEEPNTTRFSPRPVLDLRSDGIWALDMYGMHRGGTWSLDDGRLVLINDDAGQSTYARYALQQTTPTALTLSSREGEHSTTIEIER